MENFNNTENNSPSLNGFDYTSTNNQIDSGKPIEEVVTNVPIVKDEPKPSFTAEDVTVSNVNTPPPVVPNPNPTYFYNGYVAPTTNFSEPEQKQKPKKKGGVIALACILAILIGALSGGAVGFLTYKYYDDNSDSSKYSSDSNETNLPNNNITINVDETAETVVEAVAKKVTPCVVGIRTTTSVMDFFGGTSEASGDGSGVIYSSEGYIITNFHVISDSDTQQVASKIEVYLDSLSSKAYPASVVGYSISADLAVIKIDAKNLPTIEIADSNELKVGQYVITVGNPGGLEFMDSVTYGVVSGLNRTVSADSPIELIQTDAAINPGNSGGALVNIKGQLVGINSSKIASVEFEGMGFAIPSNSVVEICENIIENENSPEPYVGISIHEEYTSEVLDYYGYPNGAVISNVVVGSPAYEAGIKRGDIITEFDGKKITEYTVLIEAIKNSTPNDTVNIKVYRNGRTYKVELTIGSNNAIN